MKYSKNMLWAQPYVESVEDLFPHKRVGKLVGYRVAMDKEEVTEGITLKGDDGRFDIRIRLFNKIKYRENSRTRYRYRANYLGSLLNTLAHEIAHTVEWEHTVDHMELELKIMRRFLRTAKRLGVTDTWARVKVPKGLK